MKKWRLTYIDPTGDEWPLLAENHRGVFITEAGLAGLRGKRTETTLQLVGRDGQRLQPGGRLQGMTPELQLTVTHTDTHTTGEVWAAWHQAWPDGAPGELVLETETEEGIEKLHLPVRLPQDADLSVWDYQPDDRDVLSVAWPMVSDVGAWGHDYESSSTTTVIDNWGNALISPEVEWSGAGGTVVAPSGATFTLPAVTALRRMLLDTAENYLVLDGQGNVDVDLWHKLRGGVFATPVPPGRKATWKIPVGATLRWRVGVMNPWR